MPKYTVQDFRIIEAQVEYFMRSHPGVDTSSKAFSMLMLQKILPSIEDVDLDDDEAEATLTDGSSDFGIDAIYIEDSGDRPTVYLFQFKHYEREEKCDRNLEASALEKMRIAISRFIIKRAMSPRANVKLVDKLNDVHNLESTPNFKIIFCSNSGLPANHAREEFNEFIRDVDNNQGFYNIEYFDLRRIVQLLIPAQRRKIDLKLRMSGKYMTFESGEAKVIMGRAQAIQLARIREKEGDELFDRNIRGFLGIRKGGINEKILGSATGSDKNLFFYLNNGVTIACDKFRYSPSDESPDIEISNAQIINGGQTTNALYEAYRKQRLEGSVYVLVRVIETDDPAFVAKITEATNTQTAISARDLRSNDEIQRKIEEHLKTKGYFYEARRDKYANKSKSRRVDAVKATQAYYAFNNQQPADAKNKKRLMFGTYYEDIFNDALDISVFLFSYLLYQKIRDLNKEVISKYSFVRYSEFHTVALMKQLGVTKQIDLKNDRTLRSKFRRILRATERTAEKAVRQMKEKYSHRALFIDPDTLHAIEDELRKQR